MAIHRQDDREYRPTQDRGADVIGHRNNTECARFPVASSLYIYCAPLCDAFSELWSENFVFFSACLEIVSK